MKILIPVLVGSLIGYLTNWLAIKMLFKPHYEKKLFGVSIPFTPGLIPKERERMAKNIGNTVGTHLLSTDTIIEAISNNENEKEVKGWINEKIEKLKQDDTTVDEYLKLIIGENHNLSKEKVKGKISDCILDLIRSEKVKQTLKTFIDENIEKYNTDSLYENIGLKSKTLANKLRHSDDLRYEIEKSIHNLIKEGASNSQTIEEFVPSDILDSIDKYLSEHKDEIGDNIRGILLDEDVKQTIKYTMANVIFDRSNKFLMAFISPDMISEKIFESIEKYIEKKETNEDIIEIIRFLIEKTKTKSISSIANNLNKIVDEISIEPISRNLIDIVFRDENIDKSVEKLLNLLKEGESSNKEILKDYLWNEIERIISSEYIESKIIYSVESTINILENKHISELFKGLNDNVISAMYDFSKKIFNQFAKYELPRIISMLNVSKIVEDKINGFEIDYTEKLILDIARKELNQITRLGALLGGILGLLSPLLQYIY